MQRRSYDVSQNGDLAKADEADSRGKPRDKKCSLPWLQRRLLSLLPICTWLPSYSVSAGVSDLIAGLTVGLTVVPQGIAYALVAGLPPQYGLYSAFMGCFVYTVLGSSKDITIGPTAIMALMTGVHAQYGPAYAVLLSFLSGLIILLCGLLRLGCLIDFISVPVISGFTSAAAITIASGQVKSLLGLSIPSSSKSHLHLGIIDPWIDVFTNISSSHWPDAVLGISCSILLLLLRALNRTNWFKPSKSATGIQGFFNKLSPKGLAIVSKLVWFVCTARNAIIVIICLLFSATICTDTACPFHLTGEIQAGLPSLGPPPFSTTSNTTSNSTAVVTEVDFGGMISQLGSAVFIIPAIAILESVAIAKAFAGGKPVDASQEMLALGFCNIFGSFVQSMPTTGSFSRTAVNSASGVKTPLGGIYTGGLVILCLAFLMPYCAFIPKATLSAVIITAVIFSVEYEVVLPIWRSKKTDLLPGFACFFGCVFYELEIGIGLGVLVQIIMLLYHTARPGVAVEKKKIPGGVSSYLSITPDQAVLFPSVSYLRAVINKAGSRQESGLPVVVDCSHMYQIDYTAAQGFSSMLDDFTARAQAVYWDSCSKEVASTLQGVSSEKFILIKGVHMIDTEDWRDGGDSQEMKQLLKTQV